MPGSDPGKLEVLREVVRLAQFDRMRGVEFWLEPTLAGSLRDLVREAVRSSPGSRRPGGSASRRGSPRSAASVAAGLRAMPDPVPPPEGEADVPPPGREPRPEPRPGVLWSLPRPVSRTRTSGRFGAGGGGTEGDPSGGTRGPGAAKRPEWGPAPEATDRDEDWAAKLEAVGKEASVCRACGLCETRQNVVFGVGSAKVPLVFIGEAPGADEDRQGIPFVGRAGQLLTRIIAAMGLDRDEVYICNVLKCRPPGNRNPAPEEIGKCSPFLDQQIELLRPKVICTLGLFASQYLLDLKLPIGKLRGRVHDYHGIPVVPTYHPAALLRNPGLKATVWEDVQLVRRKLDE